MNYKNVYETNKKSSSLRKAQKILKKKLKLEKRQQKTQPFPNMKVPASQQKNQNRKKSSKDKILVRCKSQNQYSSFSKQNFNIGNLEYFNRSMKSKTQHYQRILSLDKKINAPAIVVDIAQLALRNTTATEGTERVRNSAMQRLKTQESRLQRHTHKTYMNSSRIYQPNINSKLRLSTLFHENSAQKQQKTEIKSPQKKQQKVQNFYLRKQLSKKSMFTKMIQQNYTSHLPLIKQKKIHLR